MNVTVGASDESFEVDFAGLQEHIYMVTPKTFPGALPAVSLNDSNGTTLAQTTFAYELNEPNVLPLDFATCSVNGKSIVSQPTLQG